MSANDYLASLDMYITKATSDGRTMRWAAVNSDTSPDLYQERMSYELYKSFVENIKNEVPVPDVFKNEVTSSYWDGGMPYLSISHYSDLNGDAVPGEPLELYVDGNQEDARLRAKGILFDSPLGHSVFRALKEDKVKNPDEKIRISIGFLDLAHKHGENGNIWIRESRTSVCPDCASGVGQKVYVNGYLVHLALTRVPVNTRTEMVLEEKSMATKAKKTRKEDAASIVGKDLAEELDTKNTVARSDVLVEMSDAEEKETPEVEEAETEAPVTEEKSDAVVEESAPVAYLPYDGATSMKEAYSAKKTKEEMVHVMDMFSIFQNVAWNIIDRADVTDKKEAFKNAVDEFKSLLAAKAMVEFSQAPMVELSVQEDHELQPAIDALLENIDNSASSASINERLEAINPALQELGTAITDYVSKSANNGSNEPAPAPNKDVTEILQNAIQPLIASVNAVAERLGVLESKSNATSVNPSSRIPAPRTNVLPPNLLQQKSEPAVKPGSIRDIVNKSVGITE